MPAQDERDRVWGATLRYNRRSTPQDVLAFFDEHFDELHDGLKELSLAHGRQPQRPLRPGVFTFPLEFAAIKQPAARLPVHAVRRKHLPVQAGVPRLLLHQRAAGRDGRSPVVETRGQPLRTGAAGAAAGRGEENGYFLLELFRKVIFADRDLVRATPAPPRAPEVRRLLRRRHRAGLRWAAGAGRTWATGSWWPTCRPTSTRWCKLQDKRIDLQSRLEALDILQDRIEQLERYRQDRPLGALLRPVPGRQARTQAARRVFCGGVRAVMVQPVAAALEALLAEVNANPGKLDRGRRAPAAESPGSPTRMLAGQRGRRLQRTQDLPDAGR
jgi:type VI secretion system protein ImpL